MGNLHGCTSSNGLTTQILESEGPCGKDSSKKITAETEMESVISSADQNATKLHGVSLFTSHDDIFTLNISVIETCLLVASRDSSA